MDGVGSEKEGGSKVRNWMESENAEVGNLLKEGTGCVRGRRVLSLGSNGRNEQLCLLKCDFPLKAQ